MKQEKKINGEALKTRILQCESSLGSASKELGLSEGYLTRTCREGKIYDYVINLLRLRYGISENEYMADEAKSEKALCANCSCDSEEKVDDLKCTIKTAILEALREFDQERHTYREQRKIQK